MQRGKTVSAFPVHTIQSAPAPSRASLEALQAAFGAVPNIAGAMATSSVLIDSLVGLFGKVHGGSFSEAQIQIVLLTNAVPNACPWAVAFHSFLAAREGIDAADIDAIRARRAPHGATDRALATLARTLIEQRGHLNEQDISAFLHAGFDQHHLLEVVAIVAASTLTNYTGNIAQPPLETAFQAWRWQAPLA
jgi:alkylhydroperoxidase family enzyme